MVGKKNIRSYEVSIWTLQDSFITVLKPLNLEHKGAIQDGKITLQDDGENRISFSIPMYIREKGEFIENPLWYNTEDGNLIANLRKLKVIFNKKTADERVFEFIITKVTENHEGFEKTCEVEGEGLAFNELGKQGYKISLSEDDLYNEVSDELDALKADDSTEGISVKNNINYWIDKVLAGTNWNYSIQMDWSIVDGVIDQYEEGATRYSDLNEEQRATLNFNRESNGLRRHDRIYEDAYVSSWSISNNTLIPATVVESTEKLRMVEGNESNRYNLLQSIAEAFEVYTKYKYYYDKNYHIIGREVIFYNNFLDEDNTIDLTYNYDTQSISRELDAADIVTKMYVKTLDDESYPSGLASIMDTEANKTGEDYILNFDYLYDIKTISNEQYATIKTFEKDIANLNKQIKPLDTSIIKLEEELLDAEVARDNALALMKEAENNITFITEQLKAITNDSNYNTIVIVVKENPAFIFLSKQGNNYLGKFGSQFSGIVPGTVKVYSDQACTSAVSFTQQIKDNMVQSLTFTNSIGTNTTSGYLYATFSYKPALEKEKLKENYEILYNNHQRIYNNNLTLIEGTNPTKINGTKKELGLANYIKAQKQKRQSLYEQKQALIADFENMMGPALREGNWQPEDEYVGYGDQYDENIQPSYDNPAISTTSGKLKFIWDKELFDEEEKNYYEYGINQEKVYYPCINLAKINSNIFDKLKEEDFRNGLSFVYKNSGESNPYLLPQGVNCKFAFIQSTSGGNIIPVLMITNLYNEINITNDTTASTALGYLTSLISYIAYTTDISILLNTITANNSTIFSVPSSAWIEQPHKYNIVYPRLEIQSDLLKTGTNELLLHIYREKTNPTGQGTVYTYIDKLKEFTDYSIFSKDEKKYITIKPEVLLAGKIGEAKIKINYCLANTALQIYLDAIEVMKENAYPKVSYTISQLFSPKLFYNTYDRLGQLAHINDAKLKFKNVMGYISAVELNLDKPWEDNITIQNYKNKFEDLFSTIVAQTEDMKKNAYRINAAANAFSANGLLTAEVTPESLLKSARVLNNLIKQNADVIAAKAIGEAARDKAALASTDAYRIMHGEVGLAFKGNKIDSVVLNQDKGLIIAGKTGTTNVFFQLDNAEMGFFKGTPGTFNETNPAARPVPQLYYENGNLALSGVMYAASGWFGGDRGWIIGSGLTNFDSGKLVYKNSLGTNVTATISNDDLGGLLYSANGKAIFTSGSNFTNPRIILSKNGFPNITTNEGKNDALFLFDGTNLYISGTITSTAGNIGGWHIGSNYLGTGSTLGDSKVGISNRTDSNYVFWAGGVKESNNALKTAVFSVTADGKLTATNADITGEIKATSGIIGQTNAPKINIGSTSNASTSSSWIYSGSKSEKTKNSAGFYLGTDGLALGGITTTVNNIPISKFQVDIDGTLYATGVTISGALTAGTGSKIGSWIISNSHIGNNSSRDNSFVAMSYWAGVANDNLVFWAGGFPNTNSGHTTEQLAKFRVTYGGKLYASNAELSGSLTAGSNFSVTSDGAVTAKSGTVGGWTLGDSALYLNNSTPGYNTSTLVLSKGTKSTNSIGGSPANTEKIWMISASDKFGVTTAGDLYANSANITGTIIANNGRIGGTNGWYIESGYIGNASTLANSTVGMYQPTTAPDIVFWAGDKRESAPFKVTAGGALTSTSGSIGGWTIGKDYIGNGTSRRDGTNPSTVGISCLGGTTAFVFWAGAPLVDGSDPVNDIPFYVRANGALHANNAYITGVIKATTGEIGSTNANKIKLGDGTIYQGKASLTDGNNGFFLSKDGIALGKNSIFKVTKEGVLSASKVNITGGEIKLFDSEKISYTAYDEVFSYDYEGTISLNQKHQETIEDITRTIPFTLYLHEKINYGKDEETGKDILTNYKMFYHEGELELRETGQSGTLISASRIHSNNFSTNNIDISGSSISIDSGLGIEMIAGSNNSGLKTYDEDKWIIRKNKNGEIYIDGIVHVRNSNGDWIEISG